MSHLYPTSNFQYRILHLRHPEKRVHLHHAEAAQPRRTRRSAARAASLPAARAAAVKTMAKRQEAFEQVRAWCVTGRGSRHSGGRMGAQPVNRIWGNLEANPPSSCRRWPLADKGKLLWNGTRS